MIYSEPIRTRGTDCGPDRWVTLPAVISAFEHLRWEWLRHPPLGLVDEVHRGHGFFVTKQTIALSRRFGQGVDAHVDGVLRKVGRVEARASQHLVRDDGILLAHCSITGVWTGPGGRLARIPRKAREAVIEGESAHPRGNDEARDPNSLFDPPQPLRPGSLELAIDGPAPVDTAVREVRVRATDVDIFNHVNAANYVRYLADSMAQQGASPSLHRADLRYTGQARAGDLVTVRTWPVAEERWGGEVWRGDECLFAALVETERR